MSLSCKGNIYAAIRVYVYVSKIQLAARIIIYISVRVIFFV